MDGWIRVEVCIGLMFRACACTGSTWQSKAIQALLQVAKVNYTDIG